jgi:RNA polymerase sigma-70 factor, ECF subfamily
LTAKSSVPTPRVPPSQDVRTMDDDARRREESARTATDGAELVRRFRAGDEGAFRVLFERYSALLTRRIERQLPSHLRRRVAVSDVLQESMLVAFARRETLVDPDERAFRAWLLTIAENKVREAFAVHDEAQKRSVRREVTEPRRPGTAVHPARQESPSQAAVGAEMHSLSEHAMRRLPPDYGEVLRLAHQEHLSLVDVADRIGRSHEATKKLYGRALARFREEFLKLGGERP